MARNSELLKCRAKFELFGLTVEEVLLNCGKYGENIEVDNVKSAALFFALDRFLFQYILFESKRKNTYDILVKELLPGTLKKNRENLYIEFSKSKGEGYDSVHEQFGFCGNNKIGKFWRGMCAILTLVNVESSHRLLIKVGQSYSDFLGALAKYLEVLFDGNEIFQEEYRYLVSKQSNNLTRYYYCLLAYIMDLCEKDSDKGYSEIFTGDLIFDPEVSSSIKNKGQWGL